jgi:excinuclease UvrABC ATPase subunit
LCTSKQAGKPTEYDNRSQSSRSTSTEIGKQLQSIFKRSGVSECPSEKQEIRPIYAWRILEGAYVAAGALIS